MSLEVKNIVKSYGEKVVVNDLSFTMKEPGVYALLGTNGAGKRGVVERRTIRHYENKCRVSG